MRNIFEWLNGWYETLKIKFKHPELHRCLCDYLDNPDYDFDDFAEVDRPTPKLDALMAEEHAFERAERLGKTWKLTDIRQADSGHARLNADASRELERELKDGEDL